MKTIELTEFDYISRSDTAASIAVGLVEAAHESVNLSTDFPETRDIYRSEKRTFDTIVNQQSTAQSGRWAGVVMLGRPLGVATAEMRTANRVEVAYWHREMSSYERDIEIGRDIIQILTEVSAQQLGEATRTTEVCMQVKEGDLIKTAVCKALGFGISSELRVPDPRGSSHRSRQLWIARRNTILSRAHR